MGLLSILKKLKEKEKEMRILLLGLDNAGKTTIVKQLKNEDVTKIPPTLGFNIDTLEHGDFKLNIWDVGGQKSIRSYWRNYFESTDGLVWVVDCADKDRLLDCREELHCTLKEDRLLGCSLLILANKQDLPGALDIATIEEILDLKSLKTHHWKIVGTTAISYDDESNNLLKSFDWLVHDISARLFTLD